MAWFKKKKEDEEDIPELPELPESRDFDFENISRKPESPPGLPDLEINELGPPPNTKRSLPPLPESDMIKKEISRPIITRPPLREIESQESEDNYPIRKTKKTEPIYVRLDKFETTVEAFEEIKIKIEEIESLLRKTREIKSQEEKELEEWEHEIQVIKARIESIDRNIFNKLD